jgi:long-subunit fatty acid transport protein
LALVPLLAPAVAHAAGWWALDKGTSNYGRGGANIADPQEPVALHVNPAALAGVKGLQLVVDGDMVFDRRAFTRAPDNHTPTGALATYDTVTNDWLPLPPSPGVFMAYNFAKLGLPRLTVGAGTWGPPRVDHMFPKDAGPRGDDGTEAAQRYSEIEYHALQMEMALGAGYELPWYRLRLGVTGTMIRQTVDTSLKINTFLGGDENPLYDGYVYVRAVDPWIPTATLAVSGSPMPSVTLAVAYQLAYDVHAIGKAKEISLARGIANIAAVSGDDLAVDLHAPSVFRAAAAYRHPDDSFAVELAFVWEEWSNNQQIVFHPKDVVFTTPVDDIPLQDIIISTHWRNSYSVRLGGQYQLLPDLLLVRAGGYYERGAVPKNYLSAFSLDLDKIGVTLGARADLPWGLFVDAALGYVHWLPQTVTRGNVRLVNPLTDPPTSEWPVNNGDYKGGQVIAMLALGAKLDL